MLFIARHGLCRKVTRASWLGGYSGQHQFVLSEASASRRKSMLFSSRGRASPSWSGRKSMLFIVRARGAVISGVVRASGRIRDGRDRRAVRSVRQQPATGRRPKCATARPRSGMRQGIGRHARHGTRQRNAPGNRLRNRPGSAPMLARRTSACWAAAWRPVCRATGLHGHTSMVRSGCRSGNAKRAAIAAARDALAG